MAIVDSSLKNRTAWRLGYLVAALGIYLMDQASKAWAVRRLRFADRTIIRGFLDLVYAENRGIAFGQLQEGGAFGRWFFVVLAAAAAIAVLFYLFRTPRNDDRLLGSCALLLAGILGNLTDRVRLGFVIDRKSTRLNSSHTVISYAVFCLKKKIEKKNCRKYCDRSSYFHPD